MTEGQRLKECSKRDLIKSGVLKKSQLMKLTEAEIKYKGFNKSLYLNTRRY